MNNQVKPGCAAVRQWDCADPGSLAETLHRSRSTTFAGADFTGDYSDLKQLLEKKGLFVRRPGPYVLMILFTIALLLLSVAFLAVIQDFRLQILDSALMAVISTQLAFFFHDAGHRQIFSEDRMNDALGLIIANLLLGWSYSRWITSHNQHHAHPNQITLDPDISDVPIVAFTEQQAREKHGALSALTKFQAYCFPFLTLLSAFSWRIRSIQFLWRNRVRYQSAEVLLLLGHSTLYFGLLFFLLPIGKALLFIFCHNALFGLYVGSVFAASHKGMQYVGRESDRDFLRHQVLSTRNIRAHPLSNLWYGPMACHIEHHLFPRLPRTRLTEVRSIVKDFCLERRISYRETGGLQSYWETLRHLHRVSAPLREKRIVATGKRALRKDVCSKQ